MLTIQTLLAATLTTIISLASLTTALQAAVPGIINYQGRLTNAAGTPVPDGSIFLRFQIYSVPTGGAPLWDSQIRNVQVNGGLVSYGLGQDVPFPSNLFSGANLWLGITIGADPESLPRTQLLATPYAQRVATVDGASGGDISGMVRIAGVQEGLRLQGSTVGSANSTWLSFQDGAGTNLGYVGDGSSTDQDMYLASYVGDVHLYTPAGPALTANSSGNVGIGTTTPAQDRKLDVAASGSLVSAVFGQNPSVSGNGVVGVANAPSGYGILGVSLDGFAGWFSGDVRVTGTLVKSAGSFKIDHPLDPANRYLSHSFVESPDMKNIYDGIITLDSKGEALVQLPEWFGALNKDYRYQLTCVGGYAPVYIAEVVRDNRFRIAGGTPNLTVSWQVTGIRQDAYANAHRIPVEEVKPEIERGFYLSPEALGQPAEKSIDWARRPELMRQLLETQQTGGGNR